MGALFIFFSCFWLPVCKGDPRSLINRAKSRPTGKQRCPLDTPVDASLLPFVCPLCLIIICLNSDSPTPRFHNTCPWVNRACVHASSKTPPKNPVGKKGIRKEYIICIAYAAPVDSLKTLHEKTQWEKTHQGKKSIIVDVRVRFSGPTHDL